MFAIFIQHNLISELILIPWNFMRLCYLWADAAPAPNWLNNSSCGLHHVNPKTRWSGSRWLFIQDTVLRLIFGPRCPRILPNFVNDTGYLCIILFTSLWWQVWAAKCDVCAAWISYSVVLLRVCQYEICGCQCERKTLSIWSSGLLEKCAWLIFQGKIKFCLLERLSYF